MSNKFVQWNKFIDSILVFHIWGRCHTARRLRLCMNGLWLLEFYENCERYLIWNSFSTSYQELSGTKYYIIFESNLQLEFRACLLSQQTLSFMHMCVSGFLVLVCSTPSSHPHLLWANMLLCRKFIILTPVMS